MKVYNSKSRKLETFVPLENKNVKMYVCGITPYDTTHLGHGFTYVFFDSLVRYLQFKGFYVNYTQNVTDIDDDILKKSKEVNQDWIKLGDYWTKQFLQDMKSLNVATPNNFVKATDSIPKIIEMIKALEKDGFAYVNQGNVYFEVGKFKEYGELSKYNRDQMLLLLKERGGDPNDKLKKDPLDFLLWQKTKEKEPFWESPWGKGRPGWHIECSAMINKYLGEQIDIHGGGHDLIFPHHESEIVQSESYTNKKPFVKYWMHTAMVMMDGEKMSKSLGNLVMVKDLLNKYSTNEIRFILLSHHYRSIWEYNQEELKRAKQLMEIVEAALGSIGDVKENRFIERFEKIMDVDLDTPNALKLMVSLAKRIRTSKKDTYEESNALSLIYSTLGFK